MVRLNYHKNNDIKDDKKFVDFNLLKQCDDFDWIGFSPIIDSYIGYNISLYVKGEKKRVIRNFSNFSEKHFYPSIGYAGSSNGGRGVKDKAFLEVFDLIAIRENAAKIMEGNIFAPVVVDGYGQDRNSDFLISLMLPQLSDYTEKVARQEGLEIKESESQKWDIKLEKWVPFNVTVAKFPDDLVFRLIIPEGILTPELPYSASDFIYHYCMQIDNYKLDKDNKYTQKTYNEMINQEYGSNHSFMLDRFKHMNDEQLLRYMNSRVANSKLNRDKHDKK
ncbi:hypothetical protein [Companilactobacillus muriivasis]|uniref:hypothetical protein n=1 Tax=Companilactobacillus muriivasis TaxID=3081444 RepID=UPI0030C6E7D4